VLDRIGVQRWDLLIVGDGSGSGWGAPCGWGSVLVDRQTHGRQLFFGAMNLGSVNCAESMPYLHAVNWFDSQFGKERLKARGVLNVHVLTDSQTIATWGNRAMSQTGDLPRSNLAWWPAMKEYRRLGYQCHFHWAPRSTSTLNWTTDLVAGLARRALKDSVDHASQVALVVQAINAIDSVAFCDPQTGEPINIYHLNPDEAHVSHADGEDRGTPIQPVQHNQGGAG